MTLTVAIQMDPIETVNINADSTFALALEAQKRGHQMFHYLPKHLTCRGTQLTRPYKQKLKAYTHLQLAFFSY